MTWCVTSVHAGPSSSWLELILQRVGRKANRIHWDVVRLFRKGKSKSAPRGRSCRPRHRRSLSAARVGPCERRLRATSRFGSPVQLLAPYVVHRRKVFTVGTPTHGPPDVKSGCHRRQSGGTFLTLCVNESEANGGGLTTDLQQVSAGVRRPAGQA